MMSLFLTDLQQWYREFDASSPRQQYEMFKAAIATPIPLEYTTESDFGGILVDVWGDLRDHNQVEDCLALVAVLEQQQPELYRQEFQYLDDWLILYHLFQGQDGALRQRLGRFQAEPIQSIDTIITILDDLICFQAIEPLDQFCRAIYQPVARSQALIGGVEWEIGQVVIFNRLERVWCQFQQGQAIKWEEAQTDAIAYGLDSDPRIWQEIQQNLTTELDGGAAFADQFQQDTAAALQALMLDFCRTMQAQHQLSFVCSRLIWEVVLEGLNTRDAEEFERTTPDRYFEIKAFQLEPYLGQLIGGIFAHRPARAVATVWGMPLLYEYLQARQVIAGSVAAVAIAAAAEFKSVLINLLQNRLWQFAFVHRWPRPARVSEAKFAAEAERFAATIDQSTPLSDDPRAGRLASDLDLIEASDQDWPSLAAETAKFSPPASSAPAPTPQKSAKVRQSPLQEARKLGNKAKKSGKKKSSGKGFS